MTEDFDVVVVGAGWYGLIAAQTYLKLAPSTRLLIVDDSSTVGGVWSKQRIYPSLFAQISHPLFEYSFYPMPKDRLSPDGFVSGETIHEYLDNFAHDYDLKRRIRLKTRVVGVSKNDAKAGWILSLEDGERLACDKLIFATGANSSPVIPKWDKVDFESPVIHSLEIGAHLAYIQDHAQRATVVGRSKSSYDAVYQLLKMGKKVDWVMRDGPSGPFSIYGPTFLGLWNIADHISTRLASAFSPCIWSASGILYKSLHGNMLGRTLTNVYWRVANHISVRHAGYSKSENAQKLRPRPYSDGVFWGSGGIGIATVPDFWNVFHAGDVAVHTAEVESLTNKDVVNLNNGYALASDIVIHCTGFEKGYDCFSQELQEQLGLRHGSGIHESKWSLLDEKADALVDQLFPSLRHPPAQTAGRRANKSAAHDSKANRHYRRLVAPELAAKGDRSILFPGHIHSAFTPLAAQLQALWGIAWMLGWHDLPCQSEMETEAATFNAWTRKRYLEQGRKHSYFIYDYIAYIDILMKDLGLNPYRKKNAWQELFVRYKPSDYKHVLDEYLALRRATTKMHVPTGNGHSTKK